MKRILYSGANAGLLIIKTIYSQIENKNFYKPNMSRPEIACLNDSFDLTIYKGKQFSDALFGRCITFLHHMLYLCKNELSSNEIKLIYENIEYIETTMRTEIYDKNLTNIIESEVRNNNINNKSRITNYVKEIQSKPEVKSFAQNTNKDITKFSIEINKDLQTSISNEEINNSLGNPSEAIECSTELNNIEFQTKQYNDTQFYLYWTNRMEAEKEYIENKQNKTIGDILNIAKREDNIKMKLDVIGDRHRDLKHGDTINLDVRSDHYTSKPNDCVSLYKKNKKDISKPVE